MPASSFFTSASARRRRHFHFRLRVRRYSSEVFKTNNDAAANFRRHSPKGPVVGLVPGARRALRERVRESAEQFSCGFVVWTEELASADQQQNGLMLSVPFCSRRGQTSSSARSCLATVVAAKLV